MQIPSLGSKVVPLDVSDIEAGYGQDSWSPDGVKFINGAKPSPVFPEVAVVVNRSVV